MSQITHTSLKCDTCHNPPQSSVLHGVFPKKIWSFPDFQMYIEKESKLPESVRISIRKDVAALVYKHTLECSDHFLLCVCSHELKAMLQHAADELYKASSGNAEVLFWVDEQGLHSQDKILSAIRERYCINRPSPPFEYISPDVCSVRSLDYVNKRLTDTIVEATSLLLPLDVLPIVMRYLLFLWWTCGCD
jgi:hypothetical protein